MTTVPAPTHDPLDGDLVPACDDHREYSELVVALMEVWDCAMPAAERKMESYTLGQCEYLIRERWGVYE